MPIQRSSLRFLLPSLALVILVGCAYQRRSTGVQPVELTRDSMANAPDGIWALTLISAEVPPRQRTGLTWDNDGSGPDTVMRLVVAGRIVWESPVMEDDNTPEWNITLPRNIAIDNADDVRFELWDVDQATSLDPIGVVRSRGLPSNALPDAVARLATDSAGAIITIKVSTPAAHRGTGVRLFEERPDSLLVVEVEEYSPAGRAGIVAGDWIMSIDGKSVETLGAAAIGSLSMASQRGYTLGVRNAAGQDRTVDLDRNFIWLTM